MQDQNIIHSLNLFNIRDDNPMYDYCESTWRYFCPDKKIIIHTEKDPDLAEYLANNPMVQKTKLEYGENSYDYRVLCAMFAKFWIFKTFGGWFVESDIALCAPLPEIDSSKTYLQAWCGHFHLSSAHPIFVNKKSSFLKYIEKVIMDEKTPYETRFGILDWLPIPTNVIGREVTVAFSYKILCWHFPKISGAIVKDDKVKLWHLWFDKIYFTPEYDETLGTNIQQLIINNVYSEKYNLATCQQYSTINGVILYYKFLCWHLISKLHIKPESIISIDPKLIELAKTTSKVGQFDTDFTYVDNVVKGKINPVTYSE